MGDVAQFTIAPPLRCCQQLPDSEPGICGALATRQRLGPGGIQSGYFCDEHQRKGDEPIAPVVLFRRVSVVLEVTFAGTSPIPAMAHAEALARLETAVEHVGGLVNLNTVTSAIGRYVPPPPRQVGAGRPRKAT